MKFGFDIDDTLINLRERAFHVYNEKLNQQLTLEQLYAIKTLEIHEPFGLNHEQGRRMWEQNVDNVYYSCDPFPHAIEALQDLAEKGHSIYYITARPLSHCARTKQWLIDNHFPVQEGHFFCGMNDNEKANIISKLELDYYVDDKPAVLETLSNLSLKVFMKDQSYNQHITFPRITSWSEFKRLLDDQS